MNGADYRQQEECEQQQWEEEEAQYQACLWAALSLLRGHIDADLYRACARQLGLDYTQGH